MAGSATRNSVLPLALLSVAVIGFAGINGYLPGGGDNAGYIAEAESWLASGQRLSLYEAGTPPATLKPPLFPLMLAGVEALAGRSVAAMKALLVLCAIAAVLAAWWVLRAGLAEGAQNGAADSSAQAAWLALWFALTPSLTLYTHDVLSDVPFTAAALAAIALTGRAADPGAPWWQRWLLLVLLVLAALLRAAGVIVAGACAGYLLLAAWLRRREPGRLRPFLSALTLCLLTLALLLCLVMSRQGYLGVERFGAGQVASAQLPEGTLAGRFLHAAGYYAVLLPAEVGAHYGYGPESAIYVLAGVGGLLAAVGFLELLRRRCLLIPVVWLLYQLALLCWPFLEPRFYLPTLPLFLCLVWHGAHRLLGAADSRGPWCGFAAAFLLCLAPAVSLLGTLLLGGQERVETVTNVEWGAAAILLAGLLAWLSFAPTPAAAGAAFRPRRLLLAAFALLLALGATRCVCENVIRERRRGPVPGEPGWPEFHDAALWLRQHAAPDDVVLSAKIPLVWFWSGLRGVAFPLRANARQAERALAQADWVIVDDLPEGGAGARFANVFLVPQLACWECRWSQGRTSVWRRKPRAAD